MDINKIVVSNKVFQVKKRLKYFIGYKDTRKHTPLCTFVAKMNICRREFDETKYISFFIKENEFQKNKIKFEKKLKQSQK